MFCFWVSLGSFGFTFSDFNNKILCEIVVFYFQSKFSDLVALCLKKVEDIYEKICVSQFSSFKKAN